MIDHHAYYLAMAPAQRERERRYMEALTRTGCDCADCAERRAELDIIRDVEASAKKVG